jgi:ATP-binding cassette subfamily B protein
LSVSPGETVALIGENGAGKTTMVKLLARLYDPDTGGVYLDGVDIREYALEDLRARIGVVFQDFVRYNLTLRENISFGTVTDCSDDEIRDAAGRCGATALIDRSPAGLDQLVGRRFDGGMNLSRGEWQRLALSRAQLRHPSVLILDEPAASLDPRAEEEIVGPLCAPSRDRVTLLVSHRMSSLRFATHIAVLNGGIVAEHGHHRELMARGGVYTAFVKAQRAKHIVEWQPREIA